MKLRKYTEQDDGNPADLLSFIDRAFAKGDGAAIERGYLDILNRISFCVPADSGEYAGCYLFPGIKQRSRGSRLFDKSVAFLGVVLLMPLFALIYLLIYLLDGPPVVFRQKRFGVDNREFDIYKFRTMVLKGEKLHTQMQRRWGKRGHLFKLDNDPRVTSLGSILRATYLDELPQLFNVLKGEMRLCGARPLPVSDQHHYTAAYHSMRLRGMPGITGLWQINGGNRVGFDQMCLLDVYYLCNNSLWLDVLILLSTVRLLFSEYPERAGCG